MADDRDLSELPPPPSGVQATGRRGLSPGIKVLLAVAGLVLVVGGAFLARALYWSLRPTPDFPSLATEPDQSLKGTVAFLRPFPDKCIYVVPASGGSPRKLACLKVMPGPLTWRSDGRIQSTGYKGGEGTDPTASWIIDPASGQVTKVPEAQIPPKPKPEKVPVGPNGETVACRSSKGRLTLTLNEAGGSRTLLSVGAPDTYCMGVSAWSPDGRWFLAKDDLDRILVVTTGKAPTTRVLVTKAYAPVLTTES